MSAVDDIIMRNAKRDPNYAPYCGPCPRLVRMVKIEPFYWRCAKCGAEHDARAEASQFDIVEPR